MKRPKGVASELSSGTRNSIVAAFAKKHDPLQKKKVPRDARD